MSGTFIECSTPEEADKLQKEIVNKLREDPNNLVVDFSADRLKEIFSDERYGLIKELGFTHSYTAQLAAFVLDNSKMFGIEDIEKYFINIVKTQPPNQFSAMDREMQNLILDKKGDKQIYAVSGSLMMAMEAADEIAVEQTKYNKRTNIENYYYPRFVTRSFQNEQIGKVIVANEPLARLYNYANEHTISDRSNGVGGDVNVLKNIYLRNFIQ